MVALALRVCLAAALVLAGSSNAPASPVTEEQRVSAKGPEKDPASRAAPSSKLHTGDDKIEDIEIKELFDRFDEDSNGYLNRKELFRYFVATTPPDSKMGRLYKDKDYFNLVRYRKFCKGVGADPLRGLTLQNIRDAYETHYGYAHKDWLVTAGMRSLKVPREEKQHVKDAFAAFDKDSNGFLNWPELKTMVSEMTDRYYETLARAVDADISEGLDQHQMLKLYTRKKSKLRKAIREWEKPPEDVVIVHEGSATVAYVLVALAALCVVVPAGAYFFKVHETASGRKVIKQTAVQLSRMANVE